MTPIEHSALVEEARRMQAAKPQVAAAMAQQFALWEAQQAQLHLLFRRYVRGEVWPI